MLSGFTDIKIALALLNSNYLQMERYVEQITKEKNSLIEENLRLKEEIEKLKKD